jgi:hypothetical protein
MVIDATIREIYSRRLPKEPVRAVVDAGAYIGDTTCWYLSRFPGIPGF